MEVNIFCVHCCKKFPPFYDLTAKTIHCPDCGSKDIKINSQEPSAVVIDSKEKIAAPTQAQTPHKPNRKLIGSPISIRIPETGYDRKSPSTNYYKQRQLRGLDGEKEKKSNPLGIDYPSDDERVGVSTELRNKRIISSRKILLIIAVCALSILIGIYLSGKLHIPQVGPSTVSNSPINNETGQTIPSKSKESNTFLTYNDSSDGVKLQYPSKWLNLGGGTITNQSHVIVHFAPLELDSDFFVEIKDNPKRLNLQQVLNDSISSHLRVQDCQNKW